MMAKQRSGKIAQPKKSSAARGQQSSGSGLPVPAGFGLIFCLVLLAYFPAIEGKFLWNDVYRVTAPSLRSLNGLWRIWTEPGVTQQYLPLLHSAFWVEHRLWGDAALGYHLASIMLHSISAFLVVLIVRRMRVPGAWLAGLIFALHPVCVESVAWISEQGNTLSAAFYLAAGLTFLRFDETRERSRYFWAAGLFVLALLSNSITATLPLALLIVLWFRNGRIGWKHDVLPLLPWMGVGVFMAWFAARTEKAYAVLQNMDPSLNLPERLLLAGRTFWFYVAKLLWPSGMALIYPRFRIDTGLLLQYLYPAALLALLAVLWVTRSRWRGLLAGALFFIATLFPVLGLLAYFQIRDSFVADSFQYLACLGVLIPLASGLAAAAAKLPDSDSQGAFRWLRRRKRFLQAAVCGILLALAALTWKQSGNYRDAETFWRAAMHRNPASFMPYSNLGDILFQQERADEAMKYCRMAVVLKPDNAEANATLANVLRYKEQYGEAAVYYKKATELRPDIASFHGGLATTLVDIGKVPEAITHYEASLKLDPANGLVTNNLAWILATCPQASQRNGKRAVELASRAVQLIGDNNPTVVGTLAAAYAETGRFREAVAAAEKARALALASGDSELVEWHSLLLGTYQTGQPHRESSLAPK